MIADCKVPGCSNDSRAYNQAVPSSNGTPGNPPTQSLLKANEPSWGADQRSRARTQIDGEAIGPYYKNRQNIVHIYKMDIHAPLDYMLSLKLDKVVAEGLKHRLKMSPMQHVVQIS